jgi:hypothetical protein
LVAHHLGTALDLREALGNATDPLRARSAFSAGPGTRGAAAAVCTPVTTARDANAATRQAASDLTEGTLPTAAAICSDRCEPRHGVVLVF